MSDTQGIAAALQRVRLLISIESDAGDKAALQAVLDAADPRKDLAAFDEWWRHNSARPPAQGAKRMFRECWNAALADRPK